MIRSEDISTSVFGMMIAVLAFLIVFLFSNHFRPPIPSYYVPAGRLVMLSVAALFMLISRYSLFRNYKHDMLFLTVFGLLSASLFVVPSTSPAGSLINILILAPFVEEFFFRGFMIGLVYDSAFHERDQKVKVCSAVTTIIVSLGGFMVMHPLNEYLFSFVYGFYFTTIFLAYRSLRDSPVSKYAVLIPVLPHLMNNFIVYSLNLPSNIGQAITIGTITLILVVWSIMIYNRVTYKLRARFLEEL